MATEQEIQAAITKANLGGERAENAASAANTEAAKATQSANRANSIADQCAEQVNRAKAIEDSFNNAIVNKVGVLPTYPAVQPTENTTAINARDQFAKDKEKDDKIKANQDKMAQLEQETAEIGSTLSYSESILHYPRLSSLKELDIYGLQYATINVIANTNPLIEAVNIIEVKAQDSSRTQLELYAASKPYVNFSSKKGDYYTYSFNIYSPNCNIVPVITSGYNRARLLLLKEGTTIDGDANNIVFKDLGNGFYEIRGAKQHKDIAETADKFILEFVFKKEDSTPFTINDIIYAWGYNLSKSSDSFPLLKDDELAEISLSNISNVSDTLQVQKTYYPLYKESLFIGGNIPYGSDVDDEYLKSIHVNKIQSGSASAGNNLEVYQWFYPNDQITKNIINAVNNGYPILKVEWCIYSKNKIFPSAGLRRKVAIKLDVSLPNTLSTIVQVNDYVQYCTAIIDLTGKNVNAWVYMFIESTLVTDLIPNGIALGLFGQTAIKTTCFKSIEECNKYEVTKDWYNESFVRAYDLEKLKPEVVVENNYNNIGYNQGKLSNFLLKHQLKKVDEYNQLNVVCIGDSIFGRQDKASFTPETSEMSLTPDMNNPSETNKGYITGHFPPNMWQQTIPFKILNMLQYYDADVKYFNHVASEVVLTGTWIDRYPLGADCLRTKSTANVGDSAIFTFSGASFCKMLYTDYVISTTSCLLEITISDDNGTTYKSFADLGITTNMVNTTGNIYKCPDQRRKWGQCTFKGFDKTKAYKIKFVKNSSYSTWNLWGFETWSNPRVNVIVSAEGGNTAAGQSPERFYNKEYNPSLIIYELPYLNDLGTGTINARYQINPTQGAPASPVAKDFFVCLQDGNYINFGNIYAKKDDYIEWTGTEWRRGSSKVKEIVYDKYVNDNTVVYNRLLTYGIDTLLLVTHDSESCRREERPFMRNEGKSAMRYMAQSTGFACADVNRYQYNNSLISGIYSDGTHLNDAGVKMYEDVLKEIFTTPLLDKFVFANNTLNQVKQLKGSGTAGTTINFGYELPYIPSVIITRGVATITEVTTTGFTTTGSGNISWVTI